MTNEEMMQLKQLLTEQKQEIITEMNQKIADAEKRSTANMNVLIESMIQPQMNLLAERMDSIEEKMATKKDLDELELAMDDRFDILEALVTRHGHEITRLKKAQ